MNKPEHVNVDAALRLSDAVEDRIAYMAEECWFDFPHTNSVISRCEMLIRHPPRVRPRSLLVFGESGIGKSSLLDRLVELHPVERDKQKGTTTFPIASLEMPQPARPGMLMEAFLDAIQVPRPNFPTKQLQAFVGRQYRALKVKVVLIDEVQRVRFMNMATAMNTCETIKWLSNVTRRPVVVFGTHEVLPYFEQDRQLKGRFTQIEIPKWVLDDTFRQLVKTQLLNLPMREPWSPDILRRKGLQLILERSNGVTAEIINLLKDAAMDVLLSGREGLALADIEAV